jgi:hypothetical protein
VVFKESAYLRIIEIAGNDPHHDSGPRQSKRPRGA